MIKSLGNTNTDDLLSSLTWQDITLIVGGIIIVSKIVLGWGREVRKIPKKRKAQKVKRLTEKYNKDREAIESSWF